jgi:hypothetical protein
MHAARADTATEFASPPANCSAHCDLLNLSVRPGQFHVAQARRPNNQQTPLILSPTANDCALAVRGV